MSMAIVGKDSLVINEHVFADFATGDTINAVNNNDIAAIKAGKNGNSVIAYNATGEQGELTVTLIRGGVDDKYLASEMAAFLNDPPSYVPMSGEYIKRLGDGAGNVTSLIYQLRGGVIKKIPETKENVEGDTDQATVKWTISCAKMKPILG
jgi:hypothetical protein